MDLVLITKYKMLCLSRAGGHFEVDYGASVNVGGDADHNDDSGVADHNDVDYKNNCCVSGAELVDTLKLIMVQMLMLVAMLIIMILITKYNCCSQAPSWWTACSTW